MLNGSVKQLCPESCNMCEKKSESNLFGKIQIKKFNENSLVSEKKLNVPSNTTSAPTLQKAQIDENLQPQQNYGDTILSLDETSEKDPNMKDISGINNTKQIDKKKDEVCVDEVEFSFGAVPDLNCHWVREDKLKRCNLVFQNTAIAGKCPLTCGICSEANARNLSRLSWLKNPYAMIVLGNLLGMLCALFISSTRYCKKRRGLIL
uniref:ShKT domain-containing protein n=1 Tax=Corethron hystrix TaxID=216773 RepID=A0A7S1FQ28_9STRA|mmetsp:Transcript_22211/g.50871  ORF Transcript_22211/g.50871 Transcript_22211/m.50871 type:complete len:206 (+) Transcript_22211:916-1533(+)